MKTTSNISGKIALQRLMREAKTKEIPVNPIENFKAFKNEDIAKKVERQRKKRNSKKKPTGAEGKDPKKVGSKPFKI